MIDARRLRTFADSEYKDEFLDSGNPSGPLERAVAKEGYEKLVQAADTIGAMEDAARQNTVALNRLTADLDRANRIIDRLLCA